jgi:hypothetical protein
MLGSRHATSLGLNAAQTDMKTASSHAPSAAAQLAVRLLRDREIAPGTLHKTGVYTRLLSSSAACVFDFDIK